MKNQFFNAANTMLENFNRYMSRMAVNGPAPNANKMERLCLKNVKRLVLSREYFFLATVGHLIIIKASSPTFIVFSVLSQVK